MWKNPLVAAGLALCAACATHPSAPGAAKSAAAKAEPPAGCVAATATRIPLRPGECAAFGRTWQQDDIKTTGATDAAQALRQLDPTVTVSGH
jgi:hypothetical protein